MTRAEQQINFLMPDYMPIEEFMQAEPGTKVPESVMRNRFSGTNNICCDGDCLGWVAFRLGFGLAWLMTADSKSGVSEKRFDQKDCRAEVKLGRLSE
jgi:hypothetical protein